MSALAGLTRQIVVYLIVAEDVRLRDPSNVSYDFAVGNRIARSDRFDSDPIAF